jgi:putative drug exporter of the RND superfamily
MVMNRVVVLNPKTGGYEVLQRIAQLAIAAPRRVIAVVALAMVAVGLFGIPVAKSLSAGGLEDPNSESASATRLLTEKFGEGDVGLLIVVSAPDRFDSPQARAVATEIIGRLQRSGHVAKVNSAWTSPPPAAAALISRDHKSGLIVAGIIGDASDQQASTKSLVAQLPQGRDGVVVRSGGQAMVNLQITEQSKRDLVSTEMFVLPLSFLVLVWVFGGLFAAALPVAVGVMAILGSLAVLRVITFFTDVSVFALNLTTAMGLALAIDYTLLIISRFRDEMGEGASREQALMTTMASAGRTVLFSATTVALAMAVMVVFPIHFLRSFAYAGVATVAFAAVAALVVTPAAIMLLGDRLEALDVRRLIRRALSRPEPEVRSVHQQFWYRSTKFVMRHAVPIGLAVVALLLMMGAPFLGVRPGLPDDRVLPASASAHQVGDQLRQEFADNAATAVSIVIPDAARVAPAEMKRYATDLSRVPNVASVSAPTGLFVAGRPAGPPTAPTGQVQGSALLTVESTAPLFSDRSETQLDRLHAVSTPGGRAVEFAGTAQTNRDTVHAITSRLPVVLGLIAVVTLVLLFLLTGSVVLPVKALVLNVLSLSAAFGAIVWIFQDGHLGALGTTATGTLVANMPVLLFCIAFGLSMDYEVFLVSRIREFWRGFGADRPQTSADNDESVALGVAHTGRVVTAAALIMAISFAALAAAHLSALRMFGVGLTLAVLVDATLVRMVLVPAFMHVMGRWNWWAPKPLARLHQRIGISDS